jgi:hypothetical protein
MENKKDFDAVAMVRKIRDEHYEETRHMTPEERLRHNRERGKKAQAEFEKLARKLQSNQ